VADLTFPDQPTPLPPRPPAVGHVVHRAPLSAIHEVLATTIHDVVDDPTRRRRVADFYRVTRWMQNEWWLRQAVEALARPVKRRACPAPADPERGSR
jgi:hypothetical protein